MTTKRLFDKLHSETLEEKIDEKISFCFMKVAVIGSRGLPLPEIAHLLPENTDEILSGGARGIDAGVKKWASENGVPLREFLPDYEKYGRAAPIRRNAEMLSKADLVLIFWDGKSRGTRFGLDYCKKHSIPFRLFVAKEKKVKPIEPSFSK